MVEEKINLQDYRNIVDENYKINISKKDINHYLELLYNKEIKKTYSEGIKTILKKMFNEQWVDGDKDYLSGLYCIESESGRSVLNNLDSNYNAFNFLTIIVNKQLDIIGREDKKFDFTKPENKNIEYIEKFVKAVDYFKYKIFTPKNEDFVCMVNLLSFLWKLGQKLEITTQKKIQNYFKDKISIVLTGGHGKKTDALNGIDAKIFFNNENLTAQIKPFTSTRNCDNNIIISGCGLLRDYKTNWIIFTNKSTEEVLIFINKYTIIGSDYIFNTKSLLYKL